jgi:FkbM family methyltransferase
MELGDRKVAASAECGGEWAPRHVIAAAINPHLLGVLRLEERHETGWRDPGGLLTPLRLDVVAKYLYAREWCGGGRGGWGEHVYREHLRVWNAFREGDGSGKNDFADFQASFDALLKGFAGRRFDERLGLLPVGSGDVILDGSHRLAAALAFGCPVRVARFRAEPPAYDHAYFLERGLDPAVLDDMALEYCRLDSRVRVAVLFPVARGRDREVRDALRACGPIVASREVSLSAAGRANLVRLLYRGEPWLGDGVRPTPGLLQQVEARFVAGQPARFVFFIGEEDGGRLEAKRRIRGLFGMGNDSLHINDTHRQTVAIAEAVLNANGVHHLNHARPSRFGRFAETFEVFKRWIEREGLDRRRFCIDASSVLAAYGLRDANDLDFLYAGETTPTAPDGRIACHNAQARHYEAGLDQLVMDPRNHFYLDGVKFAALDRVREMKARRGETKDRADVFLIDSLGADAGAAGRVLRWYRALPARVHGARHRLLRAARRAVPAPLLPLALALYNLPQRLRELAGPPHRTMIYRGFELHYSRGTSLVREIRDGSIYEPRVCGWLARALMRRPGALFLDIGANIGLATLNVLAEVPGVRVVAFEPGRHQARLLERTLHANRLEDRVTLVRSAVGLQSGVASFAAHRGADASGDGFLDTGRAGRARTVQVAVTSLDEWWRGAGRPRVDAIKIDTEGAEFWALRGGEMLLRACRPLVVFELHPDNLRVYPHDAGDVVGWLRQLGYTVRSGAGVEVTEKDVARHLGWGDDDFVAEFARA